VSFRYTYARPALTVDCVVFGLDFGVEGGTLQVLLIQRGLPPFLGRWALPGGFVRIDETLEDAARRELREETGTERIFLEQLGAYGAVDRDPRERVVTIAHVGLVKLSDHRIRAATDAANAAWFAVDDLPPLAFDHDAIAAEALTTLRRKIRQQPIGFELLPPRFTLTQLQRVYEAILGRSLDKRNFRKKVLALGLLRELDEVEQDVAHRAARLFAFDEKKYRALVKRGFAFDL
jgi:8-oxo-dGTP diphosphatase